MVAPVPINLADTVRTRLAELKARFHEREQGIVVPTYISTGLPSWNRNGGIERGILTVIGAATGEGKSIVKLQLARGAAKDLNKVCMIDFEDPQGKTADRELSAATGINSRLIGLLDLDAFDVSRLEGAAAEIGSWGHRVEHHVGLLSTTDTLAIMERTDADLILVDYAQAFPEDDNTTMERTIANFAWQANSIAQRKNCAVVVFSQVKADVEARGYRQLERSRFKNPESMDVSGFCPTGLGDIAWAKTLGERAKCIAYLWRENRIAAKLGANVKDNRMRLIIAKANFAEEGDLVFEFDGPTASIKDLKK